MHIKRLLKLILQVLGFLLLLEQLLFKEVNFSFKVRDTLGFFLCINQLAFVFLNLVLLLPNVHHFLLVVDFTFLQG